MRAVILAAGSGSRFSQRGVLIPKPLIPLGGLTLLERATRNCLKAGCDEVVIVLGAKREQIQAELEPRLTGLPIQWVHNDQWQSGNGTSVVAALPFVGNEHALVLMADHLLFSATLRRLMVQPIDLRTSLLAIDRKQGLLSDPGDATKVRLDGNKVTAIHKNLDPFDGFDIGAALCSPAFFADLKNFADSTGEAYGHTDGMRIQMEKGLLMGFDIGEDRWEDVDEPTSQKAGEALLFNSLRKKTDGFMSQHVERHLSLAVTRRLVNTSVTPNQMTLFVVCIGALAAFLFSRAGYSTKVIGAILFWCSSFLDGCDGELARLKFLESRLGGWLDLWADNVVHALVFTGMGIGLWRDSGNSQWVVLGLVASAGVLCSVSWVSWTTLRKKRGQGPLFTSVVNPSNADSPLANRLTRLADALSRRDFIFGVIFITLTGFLPQFLWAAAIGSHLYWLVLALIALQSKSRV